MSVNTVMQLKYCVCVCVCVCVYLHYIHSLCYVCVNPHTLKVCGSKRQTYTELADLVTKEYGPLDYLHHSPP